jgi:hypothetical protein
MVGQIMPAKVKYESDSSFLENIARECPTHVQVTSYHKSKSLFGVNSSVFGSVLSLSDTPQIQITRKNYLIQKTRPKSPFGNCQRQIVSQLQSLSGGFWGAPDTDTIFAFFVCFPNALVVRPHTVSFSGRPSQYMTEGDSTSNARRHGWSRNLEANRGSQFHVG